MTNKLKLGGLGAALARMPSEANHQIETFDQETEARRQSREIILTAVLSDASDDERARFLDSLIDARVRIYQQFTRTRESYLDMGRTLLKLRREVSAEVYNRLLSDHDQNGSVRQGALPFGKEVAFRLERVADFVDNGTFRAAFTQCDREFHEEALPAYSSAYFFTTLNEDQLVEAVKRDLVRPDITQTVARIEVAEIKRRLPATRDHQRPYQQDPDAVLLKKINKRIEKLAAQFRDLEKTREKLEGERNEVLLRMGARGASTILSIKSSSAPAQSTQGDEQRSDAA